MAGIVKHLTFSEGLTVGAPTNDTLSTSGQLFQAADSAAYVTAKGSAAADGDIFYNTTTDTIWYYADGSWQQVANLAELQTLANKTLQELFYDSSDVTISGGVIASGSEIVLRIQTSEATLNTMTGGSEGEVKILINQTGSTLSIPHAAGGTGDFLTGHGDTLELPNNAGIKVVYELASTAWHIVGGSGTDAVLEGRTIDGDLNTIQDLSLSSLKTTGNTNVFIQRDGSGDAIDSTKSVPTGDVVGNSDTQTLTNKTIDADNNTLSNIENDNVKAAAAIALDKLAATTANRALASDASGFVTASTVTDTELSYLSGVSSAVQTQLNGKQADVVTTRGDTIIGDVSGNAARLPVGTVGQVLSTDGTDVYWDTPAGSGDVTAASNIADNTIVRGDGGAKGVQQSGISIDDSNNVTGVTSLTASGTVQTDTLEADTITDEAGTGAPNFSNGLTLAGGDTLSVYDEGTWTPTAGTHVNITGSASFGTATYTRIGNRVFAQIDSISNLVVTTAGIRTVIIISESGLPGGGLTGSTVIGGFGFFRENGSPFEGMNCQVTNAGSGDLYIELDTTRVDNGDTIFCDSFFFQYRI